MASRPSVERYHHYSPLRTTRNHRLTAASSGATVCRRTKLWSLNVAVGDIGSFPTVPLVVVVALGIGWLAQGWINTMMEGDRGLGAFLRDGTGYNRSAFGSNRPKRQQQQQQQQQQQDDPLPWLKLPKLDYVEVAGQEQETEPTLQQLDDRAVEQTLEKLRIELQDELESGNLTKANQLRVQLETIMKEQGYEYFSDN